MIDATTTIEIARDQQQELLQSLAASANLSTLLAAVTPDAAAAWLQSVGFAPAAYLACQAMPAAAPLLLLLAGAYWESAAAFAIKEAVVSELGAALRQAGVPFVLLKGMAHCLSLYPDPAARPMNDIDFWIKQDDLPRAWEAIINAGWQTRGLWASDEPLPDDVTQIAFFPEDFTKAKLNIELHWDLSHRQTVRGALPLADWWARRQPARRGPIEAHILPPDAALVHAAVHQMLGHRGELRLSWLYDVDRLVRADGPFSLDAAAWARVRHDAVAAGVLGAVQAMLRLCQTWFGTPLPPAAAALLLETDEQAARLADIAQPDRSTAGKVWLNLRYMTGRRRRLAALLRILLPRPAYMRGRYHVRHPLLLPFAYARRWWRGAVLAARGWRAR